ncbi:MAG: hypothetical protein IPK17_13690 [Chloroflexi bacterium]|uniref:hypothetical protein n=1 Tax=Candidatus Flexifilum breve TaxID=3140694 RepID=UPI003135A77D|nr:hypothetical protein [Chloroflexota bacterium]
MTQPIEYVTIVEPVLEVTLIGTADRAVWAPHFDLGAQTADPVTVVLSAVETTYMGVRFRELSLSLLLDDAKGILVHAFNSSRMFAFIERQDVSHAVLLRGDQRHNPTHPPRHSGTAASRRASAGYGGCRTQRGRMPRMAANAADDEATVFLCPAGRAHRVLRVRRKHGAGLRSSRYATRFHLFAAVEFSTAHLVSPRYRPPQ